MILFSARDLERYAPRRDPNNAITPININAQRNHKQSRRTD